MPKISLNIRTDELKVISGVLSMAEAPGGTHDYALIMRAELLRGVFKRCLNKLADGSQRGMHSLKLSKGEGAALVSFIRSLPPTRDEYTDNTLLIVDLNIDKYL